MLPIIPMPTLEKSEIQNYDLSPTNILYKQLVIAV